MASDPKSYGDIYRATTAHPDFAKLDPAGRCKANLSIRSPNDVRFLSQFFEQDVKFHSIETTGSKSIVTFRFRVEKFYCNVGGNLHGAAQTMIFDHLTSVALQATGDPGSWSVSRNLNCSYLRPAPEGTICLCECEVVHTGKRLALVRGVIKRESDGAVISTCEHDKAFLNGPQTKL